MTATRIKLQPAETAPKDGSLILADFGLPYLTVAIWNAASSTWATAELHVDNYQGEWNDTYFQTEYEPMNGMNGWMPLPVAEDADKG